MSRHDREIAAIRKLILRGMNMIVEITAVQRATDKRLDALAATVDRFIRSLERDRTERPQQNRCPLISPTS